MVSRVLLLVLLFMTAWSTGVMYGSKLMVPHVGTARLEGRGESLEVIVNKCEDKFGFALRDDQNKERIYLCLRADSGYQVDPKGKPIKPGYRQPKESKRF